MPDRRLQVFHSVATMLSFTKAAETLHMTQPAVTFQVRQLEDQFNTRLFDRTHNRVSLTEAGQVVFEHSEKIFHQYEEMEQAVREITENISGSILIGASTTIAEYMLPPLLGAFRKQKPEINLRLRVGNSNAVIAMVENNIIDLGVVEGPVNNKSLSVEVCREDEMVLIVEPDHPLAKHKNVTVKDIKPYQYIAREDGSGTRTATLNYLKEHNPDNSKFTTHGFLELGSPEAVKGAVEAGMGVSIVYKAAITKELQLGSLVAIPLNPSLTRSYSFVRQRQKFKVKIMEELLEYARKYLEDQSKPKK